MINFYFNVKQYYTSSAGYIHGVQFVVRTDTLKRLILVNEGNGDKKQP
jgi:hypothetical protein